MKDDSKNVSSDFDEDFLSVGELANKLGISQSFVYNRVAEDSIPHYRIGRIIKFRLSEVAEWFKMKDIKVN